MNFIKSKKHYIFAWAVAVLVTTILAVFFQTQNIIARLNKLGGDIQLSDRLSMTLYDMFHLGSAYGIFIAIALAIAFCAGGVVFKVAKFGRKLIYFCAGMCAIFVMLFLMKNVFFGIDLIAGARDMMGLGLQMFAGAIGGLIFARVSKKNKIESS